MGWKDSFESIHQEFTLPPYEDICRGMMAFQGILECDQIGMDFVKLFNLCKENMSKQAHYDFGLRAVKSSISLLGNVLRKSGGWDNTRASVANTLASLLHMRCVEADRPVLMAQLKAVFGDVQQPAAQTLVENLDYVLKVRHGAAVLGDFSDAEHQDLIKRIKEKMSATTSCVNIGDGIDACFGANGSMLKAMRATNESSGMHLIFVCGTFKEKPVEWMENMNTVLDDNKALVTEAGERIRLGSTGRVVFFFKTAEGLSPASVSRLGWVCK